MKMINNKMSQDILFFSLLDKDMKTRYTYVRIM